MILAIQPEETVRSFVERTLFIKGKQSSEEAFREFPKYGPVSTDILKITELLGWAGCYGLNMMLHKHTDYPITAVFKNIQDISYSAKEYLVWSRFFYSNRVLSGFCPICVDEDVKRLGFSFWRRAHCSDLKVCAEHNVTLVKHCPVCEKQFSHSGHDLGGMWKTCQGRHLKDCPATMNTDPLELKKSQIFTSILLFTHHLSEEAVLAVLKEKIHLDETFEHKIWNSACNTSLGDIFERRLRVVRNSRSENRLPPTRSTDFIFQAIVETYETFAEFVSDVKAYGDELRPIESLWSTYEAGSQESTHFVEEVYDLGVGVWCCPYPAKENWGGWDWRPVSYPCCNFERPKRKGPQPQPKRVGYPPPGIYRRQ
ncbi:TniQ family protein [Pseudomonas sp. PDM30]|uniref:TniQ family protein n=1 Tax=Pseudomonas sp. PDM30 TaxID=2854773 RepID=UPI001C48093D|nr:TniQ family protein [Pseudomonas sp. PDM30]MBV7488017.1 TniQ family protein [Pseudomonas sp. PDM30]